MLVMLDLLLPFNYQSIHFDYRYLRIFVHFMCATPCFSFIFCVSLRGDTFIFL